MEIIFAEEILPYTMHKSTTLTFLVITKQINICAQNHSPIVVLSLEQYYKFQTDAARGSYPDLDDSMSFNRGIPKQMRNLS